MQRSTVLNQLPIRPSDFVVEIGAGPTPFRYTKLILDKYPFENRERHGDIVNLAPVIKADALKIPLKDKACDVLFVSHVLEHMEEPARFIDEAKRCARHVYLEFPSANRELMYAWSFHRWLIEVDHGRLVFFKHDIPQLFSDFFHAHYDFPLDVWSEERFEELNIHLYVKTEDLAYTMSPKGALEHVLERSANGDAKINFRSQYGQTGTGRVRYPRAVRLKMMLWAVTPQSLIQLRNRRAQRSNRAEQHPLSDELLARLLCQHCRKGTLRFDETEARKEIVCEPCGARYRATDGVFDFDV